MNKILAWLGVVSLAAVVGISTLVMNPREYQVTWDGATDYDMLKQARQDIKTAKFLNAKKLVVNLTSPGGPVVTALEIADLVRRTSDAGLPVEIHANTLCASGCTFVLASGTPGMRYIDKQILFLVHPVQGGGWGGLRCIPRPKVLNDQEDRILNEFYLEMFDAYHRYTGQPMEVIQKWMTCGNEQVGRGDVAVILKIADKVENDIDASKK